MRLHLIRHGETVSNTERRYIGTTDSPFTTEGKRQWNAAIDRLIHQDIQCIYSSPSMRCLSQAKIVARIHGMEPIIDERITEMHFGVFENLTWQEAAEKHSEAFIDWTSIPYDYVIPNGESQAQLDHRTKSFIEDIKAQEHRNVAVFTHGGTIMSIISHLLDFDQEQKWRFKVTPGTIVTIDIEEGYACLVL